VLVLALLAILVLTPLLYIPGLLIARALCGAAQPPDALARHYERVVVGALLNGWLALTLAELGIFSAWLHVLVLTCLCAGAAAATLRRGGLRFPGAHDDPPLGIVARARPTPGMSRTKNQSGNTRSPAEKQTAARRWGVFGAWDTWLFAIVGVVFAFLVARPFEVVLGARDAGVYANTGFAIARTGAIIQYDPLVAQIGQDQTSADDELRKAAEQAETNFLGVQHEHRTIATRLRATGFYINSGDLVSGRVVPQFFHLFPAWIGLLAALFGLHGGLLATGVLGFLGVWSVGMLGRRLAGPWVGLLAMLFLALNGVQVWFSRYSTSEAAVQFLTFAGLYAFAAMNETSNTRHETPDDVAHGSSFIVDRSSFAALIAGLALGQVALTRIDFALVVAPALAYLFYIWLTRRWTRAHTLLAGGLGAMLLHAALHVVFIARAYFFDTLYARLQDYALTALVSLPFLTPTLRTYYHSRGDSKIGIRLGPGQYLWNWQRIAIEAIVVLLALAGIWALRRWGQPLVVAAERALFRWRRELLLLTAAGIVALAAYGYLIRPRILTPGLLAALPGCLSPAQLGRPGADCLMLQGYIGAPIAVPTDLRDLFAIPLANLVRVGWYLSPLGIVLGVAGFALWWRRGMDRRSWLFFSISLLAAIFFVRQSYGSSDQSYIYILRRYVPQVYPAFSLGIAYALVRISDFGFWIMDYRSEQSKIENPKSKIGIGAASALTLALVGFMALTNRGIYQHVEYGGVLAQLQSIAGRFGPGDVLLFHSGSRDEPDLVATPLKYAFGVDAFTIKSGRPDQYAPQLAVYMKHWQEQGRTVYVIFGPSGGFGLPGLQLEPAGRVTLQHLAEFEQLTDQKPHNVQDFNLDFAAYRVADAASSQAPAPIMPNDYAAQVGGFYRAERVAGVDLAWTQGDALLRLPWPRGGEPRSIALRLAGGVRPASIGPARVCLDFWPETNFRRDPPEAIAGTLGCFELSENMTSYSLTIDPRVYHISADGALLLRIRSDTWVPAQADRSQIDRRSLGVQFGGLSIK
jgi:hypothetical protein